MKAEWKATVAFVAAAWVVFLCGEVLGDSGWKMLSFFVYFVVLLAGAIALIVRLVLNIAHKRTLLAPLAMVLAVLPFCFMLEIREGVARTEDFFLRSARLQIVEELQTGALETDEYGFADLPEGKRYLSEDGEVRMVKLGDGRQAVAFYNLRVPLGGAFSTVYCPGGNPPNERLLGAYEIHECKPLGNGWYYVRCE